MKKRLHFLILISLIFINCLYAQSDTETKTRVLPSFSQIVPNLKLMESAYPDANTPNTKTNYYYGKDAKSGIFKFIGKVIYSDSIVKNLKLYMATKESVLTVSPQRIVKKLIIYADSFVLSQTIWFPGTDIIIQSRVINMQNYDINSSGVSWKTASDYTSMVEGDDKDGKNGAAGEDAGNITLITDKIFGTGRFIANGGDGASVFVPKITVNYPTSQRTIEVSRFAGCSDEEIDKSRTGRFYFDYDISAIVCYTANGVKGWFLNKKCTEYRETIDPSIRFSTKDGESSRIYDTNNNRVKSTKYSPGQPGSNGKITLNGKLNDLKYQNDMGKLGKFIARDAAGGVNYGTPKTVFNEVAITRKQYCLAYLEIFFDAAVIGAEIPPICQKQVKVQELTLPNSQEETDYNTFIKGINGQTFKNNNPTLIKKDMAYQPNPEYLTKRLDFLQNHYAVYYKKSVAEKAILDAETQKITEELKPISENPTLDDKLKPDYAAQYHRALSMSNYNMRNIDEFGNVLGYRPKFSLENTMMYMKTNLRTDLELFVMADILASDENQAGIFLQKVPALIDTLNKKNDELSIKLVDEVKRFESVKPQIIACDLKTDTLKEKLQKLENEIYAQAKKNQEWDNTLKTMFKAGALLVNCIPYGQPMTGQIGGTIFNELANNVDNPGDRIVLNTLSKIDMSGMLKSMAQDKLKSSKPNGPEISFANISWDKKQEKLEERYAKDLKKYNDKVDALNKTYTKRFEMGKDVLTSMASIGATESDIQKRIAGLKANNHKFADICYHLSEQNRLKQEIFSKLNDALQRIGDLQTTILQNASTIFKLQRHAGQSDYSLELEEAVYEMRDASLNRLKWIEYQMIKSYEYTVIAPYSQSMPSSAILKKYYDRTPDKKTMADVKAIVDLLEVPYKALGRDIGDKIVSEFDPELYKVDNDYRTILLVKQDTLIKTQSLLAELNREGSVVIDLKNDFIDKIIKPSQAETRLKDVKLKYIEFEGKQPKSASYNIRLEVLDGGMMRSHNNNFYLFKTGKQNGISDVWAWDVEGTTNGDMDIKTTSNSDVNKALISFISTGKTENDSKISRFTSPPAWSHCRIVIENDNGGKVPPIKSIEFGIQCEYYQLTSGDPGIVLDVKCDNAPLGNVFTSKITGGEKMTHTTNYYTVASKNSKVELEINTADTSISNYFIGWQILTNNSERESKDKKLTIPLDKSTLVYAIFERDKILAPSSRNTLKITLYESPSKNSPILKVIHDRHEITPIKDTEKDGFQRVVYKGVQEAYIKEK